MENEGASETGVFRIDAQGKKRFCCGAAKRLKDKCLRFHQNEDMCADFIKGKYAEMQAIKNVWQSNGNSKVTNFQQSSPNDPNYQLSFPNNQQHGISFHPIPRLVIKQAHIFIYAMQRTEVGCECSIYVGLKSMDIIILKMNFLQKVLLIVFALFALLSTAEAQKGKKAPAPKKPEPKKNDKKAKKDEDDDEDEDDDDEEPKAKGKKPAAKPAPKKPEAKPAAKPAAKPTPAKKGK